MSSFICTAFNSSLSRDQQEGYFVNQQNKQQNENKGKQNSKRKLQKKNK